MLSYLVEDHEDNLAETIASGGILHGLLNVVVPYENVAYGWGFLFVLVIQEALKCSFM